jgi:sortase A
MRQTLRVVSTLLIVVGALMLADAAATVLWQEPLSALYAGREQGKLDDRLKALEQAPLAAVDQRALRRLQDPQRRLAFAARALRRHSRPGDPLGRIEIKSAGVSDVFVEGTGTSDLRKGPGHYPATPLPGERGTVGIAGHRTTYGAPFRKLDKVGKGDRIEVRMPYGTFVYKVEQKRIVAPTALWVTRRTSYDRLILSACHPLYSAAQRIVVFARLIDTRPKGDRIA